jgi:ribose transport system substrate-binding protein
MRSLVRALPVALVALIALAVLAGCGSSSSGSSGGGGGGGGNSATDRATKAARADTLVAMKGHMTQPPTTPNPAAKSKNVWILEVSAVSPSVTVPAKTAVEAAKALGWKTTVYDAKANPGNYLKGINSALSNGADAVILLAIDCSYIKNALQQAKQKGVGVTAIYAFDCNETNPGSPKLFSAGISFGTRFKSLPVAWEQWGADQASWIIANTKGKARPLILHNEQIAVLRSFQDGFERRMSQCSTCKVINTTWDITKALAPDEIAALIKSAALKNPEINSSGFGSTVTSGFSQGILALGPKGRQMKVIGGLGLPEEFDLIRQDKGLNATTAWPQEWIAYAAIDSLNSFFNKKPLEDEGIGWQVIDNTNKSVMPAAGQLWQGNSHFRETYKKRWGVG